MLGVLLGCCLLVGPGTTRNLLPHPRVLAPGDLVSEDSLLYLDDETFALAEEYGELAARHGLSLWIADRPHAYLFSATDRADACWQLALLQQAQRVWHHDLPPGHRRPRHPLVVFHFQDRAAYDELIDHLVAAAPYLRPAAATHRAQSAFTLYRPALVAHLEDQRNERSDSRDSLLVHMTGHLLLHQISGVLPFWLREATGLHLEARLLDRLHAYCAMDDFVPTDRPGSWRREVSQAWHGANTGDEFAEILNLEHGEYRRNEALRALALLQHLLQAHPADLARSFHHLHLDRERNLRQNPVYLPDATTQLRLLDECLSANWQEQALKKLTRRTRPRTDAYGKEVRENLATIKRQIRRTSRR